MTVTIVMCNHGCNRHVRLPCCNHGYNSKEWVMSFLVSVAALSAVYLVVGRLERVPTLRFRRLSSPRAYLATDLAWYGVAIVATAVSVFVFRPVLATVAIR